MSGVVMLVNEFPPLPVGGAERQAERLSAYLAGRAWQVLVLTRGAAGLAARENRTGVEIRRVRPTGPGKVKSLTFVLGTIWQLWRERSRYPILHAHLAFGPSFAAAVVGGMLKRPVIVKLGNSGVFGDIATSQRTLRGRIRLAALRRWASTIIVLDEQMKEEAQKAGFKNIRTIANGIDASLFTPAVDRAAARQRLAWDNLSDQDFCLLFTGRLGRQKSLDTLLNAFAQARAAHPHLRLVIVGDGEERASLEHTAETLGIRSAVLFTGRTADVLPYLQAADAFVLPSVSEGISNALLEAMSCELACIATAVGGTPAVLGSSGVLVPSGSEAALTEAMCQLAGDPAQARRLGALARQKILAEFDFNLIGERYIRLYEEIS